MAAIMASALKVTALFGGAKKSKARKSSATGELAKWYGALPSPCPRDARGASRAPAGKQTPEPVAEVASRLGIELREGPGFIPQQDKG